MYNRNLPIFIEIKESGLNSKGELMYSIVIQDSDLDSFVFSCSDIDFIIDQVKDFLNNYKK